MENEQESKYPAMDGQAKGCALMIFALCAGLALILAVIGYFSNPH